MANTIETTSGGPYHAPDAAIGGDAAAETWLCRCGRSANKPHCDGSHRAAGFQDPAIYDVGKLDNVTFGSLSVDPRPNGPLLVTGGVEVRDAAGTVIFRGDRAALCRCGGSSTKPFCDGAHRQNGFTS